MPPAALDTLVLAIFGARANADTTFALFSAVIVGAVEGSTRAPAAVGPLAPFMDIHGARNDVGISRTISE